MPLQGSRRRVDAVQERSGKHGTNRTRAPAWHQESAPPQATLGSDGAGHCLRRGGGDLDAGGRRGSEPRRADAGSSSSARPTSSSARSSRPMSPPSGRQAFILNYGLKYDDYDRILATVPTIRRALPVREIRKQIRHLDKFVDGRVVGTTLRIRRVQPPGDRQGAVPHRGRQRPGAELRRARRRDGPDLVPVPRGGRQHDQARAGLLQGRRRHARAVVPRRRSAAASRGKTSTRTSTFP